MTMENDSYGVIGVDGSTDSGSLPSRRETSTEPTVRIVREIAAATGRAPTELPQLHTAVDTDALNNLFSGDESGDLEVSFTYDGYSVTVRDEDLLAVDVDPIDE